MAERERMEATDGGSDGTKTVDASGRGEVGAVKKVVVVFRATGDAPVLKQSRFKVEVRGTFARIVQLLCKQIQKDSVLVYLDSSFLPSMDDSIADLVEVRIAGSIVSSVLRPLDGCHVSVHVLTGLFVCNTHVHTQAYGSQGTLVLNYSLTPAWG